MRVRRCQRWPLCAICKAALPGEGVLLVSSTPEDIWSSPLAPRGGGIA